MNEDRTTAVIACSLEQGEIRDRLLRWRALAARALTEVEPTEAGVRLAFEAGAEDELQALVTLERHCCAFADWSVQADGDQLGVEISAGSEQGVAAIRGMFAGLRLPTSAR